MEFTVSAHASSTYISRLQGVSNRSGSEFLDKFNFKLQEISAQNVASDTLVKFLIYWHTTLNTRLGRFMMATNLVFLHKYDVLKTYPRGLYIFFI